MFLKNAYQTMILSCILLLMKVSQAERFIRTLKNKLYKHMTATGKNVYYDVLDDVVNEYNNTKHNTIKMKPKDVKNDNNRKYIDEYNLKNARFNVGDRVRISKFKNIFAKGYTPNWSREIFIVNEINDTVPYTLLVVFIIENYKRQNYKNE